MIRVAGANPVVKQIVAAVAPVDATRAAPRTPPIPMHEAPVIKRYADLLADAQTRVREIQPWDLRDALAGALPPLVLDVREAGEFARACIPGSLNVPRGVLEQACEWDFEETIPALAGRAVRSIVVVCRSGNRSLLAADVMQQMGFAEVSSLRTGVRGWNDFEQPLIDADGMAVDGDEAERRLAPSVGSEQRRPG